MNDDIERLLDRLTPRGVRAELRVDVLAAVTGALQAEPDRLCESRTNSPWLRRSALVVAASLLVGVALNVWANETSKRRLARLFGPPPVSKRAMEIADAIEEITDAQTAQWVYRRLTVPHRSDGYPAKYYATLERLIRELETVPKDSYYEPPEKDTEMDRDRPGRAGGDRTGCQRRVRLDHRYTA